MATCDVTQLLADGRCFLCLNPREADVVLAQMLCNLVAAASMAETCSQLFQDDFNAVFDNPALQGQRLVDPPWWGPDSCAFAYDSGAAQLEQAGEGGVSVVRTSSFVDGYVQAITNGTGLHYVTLRWNDFSDNYAARIDQATNILTLQKNGTTTLASVSVAFVAGSLLRLEARGSQLTVKYGGVTQLVVNDGTSPITTAGMAGIGGNDDGADFGARFEDFECCSWD